MLCRRNRTDVFALRIVWQTRKLTPQNESDILIRQHKWVWHTQKTPQKMSLTVTHWNTTIHIRKTLKRQSSMLKRHHKAWMKSTALNDSDTTNWNWYVQLYTNNATKFTRQRQLGMAPHNGCDTSVTVTTQWF